MYFSKQHDTKYTVTYLLTGGVLYFDTLEQARCYALANSDQCLSIREPKYSSDISPH